MSAIWIPEHGDAGLIAPADHIMEREGERSPETAATARKEGSAAPAPPEAASEPQPQPGPAERRHFKVALRQAVRRNRRRQVRADNRLLYWAHQAGRGPRPPIQAVRSHGRYLDVSSFRWDAERRRWTTTPLDEPQEALAA
jgi:hypothetical protein